MQDIAGPGIEYIQFAYKKIVLRFPSILHALSIYSNDARRIIDSLELGSIFMDIGSIAA